MRKRYVLFLLVIAILFSSGLSAQNNLNATTTGRVSGTLVDQASREPVGFANVVLYPLSDTTKITNGAMTNEQGAFVVDNLPVGSYLARITLIGYASRRLPAIAITANNPAVNLGTIPFSVNATRLGEVQVQGERPLVSYGLDRKVINVAQDLTSIAGTATDVMKNVPSVSVDADGAISMRGSSNLRILIDGRPTGMVAADQAQVLEQIPASSIESVEIITNPSSKFDAEGEGGIINIILKKEDREGFNGLASFNIGTNNRYNTSLSGNYQYKKLNVFGSYDFRQDNRNGFGTQNRTGFNEAEAPNSYIEQAEDETDRNLNNAVKIGADYAFRPDQTFSTSVVYRNRNSTDSEVTQNRLFNSNRTLTQNFSRTTQETDKSQTFDYNLGYRKTFAKKRRELTADLIYTTSAGDENQDISSKNISPLEEELSTNQRSFTNENNNQLTAQVDYTDPIGEDGRFDAGYKSIVSQRDDDYRFENQNNLTRIWINDPNISNNFILDQQIHALYATYGNKWGKLSYQLGGRLEGTKQLGLQRANNTVAPDTSYFNFFPSVFVTHTFNDDNQVQASYSRRINRPNMWNLNPFIDVSDTLNIRQGNPYLRPEFANAFELSQIHYSDNGSINTTLFFRQTNDVIERFTVPLDSFTNLTTPINLASRQAYGLELVASRTLFRIWKINGNASAFRNILTGNYQETIIDNRNFSWSVRLNSNITFWKGIDLQVAANYRSPVLLSQGTMSAIYFAEMALKKDVLNNKGTITFRLNDIFNTQEYRFTQFGENFTSENYRKRQSRIAFLGFSYRFGNMTNQSKRNNRDRDQNNEGDDANIED